MRANPNDTLPQLTKDYVSPGSQLTVTVGRNLGSIVQVGDVVAGRIVESTEDHLSRKEWESLQNDLRALVVEFFAPTLTFGPFSGQGEWEGVTEESSVLIVVTHYPATASKFAESLANLATVYGQDAIAWSFGPNLVTARS